MSTIKQDYIHEMCAGFSSFIEELPQNLTIKYIFHRRGQRNDAVELESRFFQSHPAGAIALNLLRKAKGSQNSLFHGLAVETTSSMMGLREKKNAIGVISINLDNHETTECVLHEAYHLGWFALDAARLLQHPKYKNSLKSGPLTPKRSPLNMAKATLKADIFSALVLAGQGVGNIIKGIAATRSQNALIAKTNGHPWNYPYPLAFETTQKAYEELINTKDRTYHFISTPLQYATSIGNTMPEEAYQQWWDFCEPAQEMAWQDTPADQILAKAIHTSEDPIVKVTAFLVKDCTGLKAEKTDNISGLPNAFISKEQNQKNHEHTAEETFELILTKGIELKSAQPFIDKANEQNHKLTEGKVFGWCASALQAAARTLEKGDFSAPTELKNFAKLGFKASQQEMRYDSLVTLGEKIIERRKNGEVITLEDIDKIAQQQNFSSFISSSVKTTVADPSYKQSLQAAQDMNNVFVPQPKTPSQEASLNNEQQHAPKAAPNIGTGMGGGMMGGGNQSTPITQTSKDEDTKKAE